MGIWLRSQDRKLLILANEISIEGNLPGYDIWADRVTVGEYSTANEAIKVLDMIDNQVEALEYYKCVGKDRDMPCPPFVFQMPPAGFSEEKGE